MSAKKPKAAISWSSGKDSAYALLRTIQSGQYDVVALLTTITRTYERVAMHGVREELLEKQAECIGLPLIKIDIPARSTNEIYEKRMRTALDKLRDMGVKYVIFGDLFLQDIRVYREEMMKDTGIDPVFPLWNSDTRALGLEMIEEGIEAKIVCIDTRTLDTEYGGKDYNRDFLDSLPTEIDPCGENGEFHTFVHNAPFFNNRIPIRTGDSVERDGFFFTDIVLDKKITP